MLSTDLTPKTLARFWAKVHKTDTCWLWTATLNNKGYGKFKLEGKRQDEYAHRVAWLIATGEPPPQDVCHDCDTPACVRYEHLFLGSDEDNMADMAAKFRGNTTKLNQEQIERIRVLVQGHQTYGMTKLLSEEFGVHRSTIRRAAKQSSFRLL